MAGFTKRQLIKLNKINVTPEMLERIHTDSDIEDLADELGIDYRLLNYAIMNKCAEGTPCHNCRHVGMGMIYPCNDCSRQHTTDHYESI